MLEPCGDFWAWRNITANLFTILASLQNLWMICFERTHCSFGLLFMTLLSMLLRQPSARPLCSVIRISLNPSPWRQMLLGQASVPYYFKMDILWLSSANLWSLAHKDYLFTRRNILRILWQLTNGDTTYCIQAFRVCYPYRSQQLDTPQWAMPPYSMATKGVL